LGLEELNRQDAALGTTKIAKEKINHRGTEFTEEMREI
jgi:hypothetical protein